ncbi:MAG TPA: hypothetical protein VGJ63_16420 [Micromonosporaceae bacterium]|jgi:hypothetical protein
MNTAMDEPGGPGLAPAVPVASFTRYAAVERVMEALVEARVPANRTAVIGRGFHRNGRPGWLGAGRAAVLGGFGLAWAGGMLAVFVAAIGDTPPERMGHMLLWGILLGGVVGALSVGATQILIATHSDAGAATRFVADRYDLYVDPAVADRVARIVAVPPRAN